MGIRILSGGGFHDWIDSSHRKSAPLPSGYTMHNYQPMVCLNCKTQAWRGRGDGRIYIVDTEDHDRSLRGLTGPEKNCEYMVVKRVMET